MGFGGTLQWQEKYSNFLSDIDRIANKNIGPGRRVGTRGIKYTFPEERYIMESLKYRVKDEEVGLWRWITIFI